MYSEENTHNFNCSTVRLTCIYRIGWDIGTFAEICLYHVCKFEKVESCKIISYPEALKYKTAHSFLPQTIFAWASSKQLNEQEFSSLSKNLSSCVLILRKTVQFSFL